MGKDKLSCSSEWLIAGDVHYYSTAETDIIITHLRYLRTSVFKNKHRADRRPNRLLAHRGSQRVKIMKLQACNEADGPITL